MHHLPRALHPSVCWQHLKEGGHEAIANQRQEISACLRKGSSWVLLRANSYKTNSSCLTSAQKAHGAPGTAFEPGPGTCVHCQETDFAGQNVLRGILSTAITDASYTNIKAKVEQGLHERHAPVCVSSPPPVQPVGSAGVSTKQHNVLCSTPDCAAPVLSNHPCSN